MKIQKAYENEFWDARIVTLDDLKNNLDGLSFDRISFDNVTFNGDEVVFTDENHPLVMTTNILIGNILFINEDCFNKNPEFIINIIKYICENKKSEFLRVSDLPFINQEIILSLCKNSNLKFVGLGTKDEPYLLTKEDYDAFKQSNIEEVYTYGVVDELKENFDSLIHYNTSKIVFCGYSYASVKKSDSFIIDKPINPEELSNLKYVSPGSLFVFVHNSYDNTFEVIRYIKNNNLEIEIQIDIENKNEFNNYIFNNLDKVSANDVFIKNKDSLEVIDLLNYIKYEKRLLEMVKPAIEANLSPFERYLFAYNIVKKFKKYKEDKENPDNSRNLYKILDNEYMVCVGYSHLLGDLLDKLNISNTYYGVSVNVGFDKLEENIEVLPEDAEVIDGGHARRQVRLVDEKYGIDGIFLTDPTWDNDMENDSYVHALLTPEEYNGLERENYLSFHEWSVEELFFAKTLEEFYYKVNLWMNRNMKTKIEEYFVDQMLSSIKDIDIDFYNEIVSKYPVEKIFWRKNEWSREKINEIITDIGEYIVSKTNTPITGEQYKEAITVLYRDCYGYNNPKELETKVNQIMEYNEKRQSKAFPHRYRINEYDEKFSYANASNKFDMEENNNKTI